MEVYVVVYLCEGLVEEVQVFESETLAKAKIDALIKGSSHEDWETGPNDWWIALDGENIEEEIYLLKCPVRGA